MRKRIHTSRGAKRGLVVTAVVVSGMLALSACSSSGGALATSTPNASGAAKHFTLVVPTSQAPWNPAYAKVVQEYENETGNTIDLRPFPNPNVKTEEVNDIQSGNHTFDVYQINEGADTTQFNENKWVEPFKDVDPSYKADSQIFSYSNISNWDQAKGIYSASGVVTSAPLLGNVDVFIYRKDIYKKLGLKVPTTWAQVISNGQKIQASGDAKYGGAYRTQGTAGTDAASYEFQALMNSAGASWFKNPGTNWTPTADSAAAVKAATWYRDLAKTGPSATNTMGQAQVIAAIQSGDAAQGYAVAAAIAPLEDPTQSAVAGKLGFAALPAAGQYSSSATGLWVLAIPVGLPKQRAKDALSFIQWVDSQKAQTLFAQYGGIPIRSDAYNPPATSAGIAASLKVVQETAAKLPPTPTSLRYPFGSDMLNITETVLPNIAAGTVTPQQGMQQIQTQLQALIKKNGLPE
jgi:multiple sugar transport system substrate-binding protein